VAAILGKIDAIEVTSESRKVPLWPWIYRLWDAGLLVPLVGASEKVSNRVPLGSMRTYARVESGTWIAAVRSGHTYVTEGPLLSLEVDGVNVRATARRHTGPASVQLVVSGQVVAEGTGEATATIAAGWVAARCRDSEGFAHTSPVVVGPVIPKLEAVEALQKHIEQLREWINKAGRFANPKRKANLIAHCDDAQAKLSSS
jgi:hypothetical protein